MRYTEFYKPRRLELNRIWREANPKRVHASRLRWLAKNPNHKNNAAAAARVMKRYAAQKNAIPKWADFPKIDAMYREASRLGMHVDHIVPIQSKIVCGLHVHDNLQLLDPKANFGKGNRFWPDMPGLENQSRKD